MAFLDNSGDIILDAVLTDSGRARLAKGDGSFRITKFALGDDEINYALYDKNNASGSAYFDLNILQTPIFEAFSNNIASLNSRLISISRNNLLYLPVIKINNRNAGSAFANSQIVQNGYVLSVDSDTSTMFQNGSLTYNGSNASTTAGGILLGNDISNGAVIRLDQGVDSANIPATLAIDPDLKETQYLVEIDNRFGQIAASTGGSVATPSFIDDDDIATYYFSQGVDTAFIENNDNKDTITAATANNSSQVIAGSRGTIFKFRIKSSTEVATSDFLFNQVGTNVTSLIDGVTVSNVRSIVTSVRITGLTTGYSVEIPLVLFKKIS